MQYRGCGPARDGGATAFAASTCAASATCGTGAGKRQRSAQAAIGLLQSRRGCKEVHVFSCHQTGELGVPASSLERFDGPVGAHAGNGLNDPDGAVPQLGVRRSHVHHEVAVGLAEQDHD